MKQLVYSQDQHTDLHSLRRQTRNQTLHKACMQVCVSVTKECGIRAENIHYYRRDLILL